MPVSGREFSHNSSQEGTRDGEFYPIGTIATSKTACAPTNSMTCNILASVLDTLHEPLALAERSLQVTLFCLSGAAGVVSGQ